MKKEVITTSFLMQGQCAGPKVCPLSQVRPGATVNIKQFVTTPEVTNRLREMGFREQQNVTLVAKESNIICRVCNARLGISHKLADSILVEPTPATPSRSRKNA